MCTHIDIYYKFILHTINSLRLCISRIGHACKIVCDSRHKYMTMYTHVNVECHFIALLSLPARGTCIFTPSTLHMYMYTAVTITPDHYQTAYTIQSYPYKTHTSMYMHKHGICCVSACLSYCVSLVSLFYLYMSSTFPSFPPLTSFSSTSSNFDSFLSRDSSRSAGRSTSTGEQVEEGDGRVKQQQNTRAHTHIQCTVLEIAINATGTYHSRQ